MLISAIAADAALSPARELVLIGLQIFQVFFLAAHDWVPLGKLNDVAAVKSQDSTARLIVVTLIQTVPFAFGLIASLAEFGHPYPSWLRQWLFISYLVLLVGQLRAWWVPYFFSPDPKRAERYRAMFSQTHSFLPMRNGITPNTAHILLHLSTLATLVVLLTR